MQFEEVRSAKERQSFPPNLSASAEQRTELKESLSIRCSHGPDCTVARYELLIDTVS